MSEPQPNAIGFGRTSHEHESCEVVACSHAAKDCTPKKGADGEIFGLIEALEKAVMRVDGNQVTQVVDGAEPTVLVSSEMCICLDTHDTGVGEPESIEVLSANRNTHKKSGKSERAKVWSITTYICLSRYCRK